MKCFVVLFVFACAASAWAKIELSKEKIIKIAGICKDESDASEVDVQEMFANLPASTTPSKCLRACVLKKLEMTDENGALLKEPVEAGFKFMAMGEASKEALAEKLAKACLNIKLPSDRCEAGEENAQCLIRQMKDNGFKPIKY